ncbi:hypothetical protein TIFTF001_023528 [Ficus carica]|uniref:Uncharacterized protein n=1 Tax=Ficus carica TaxID=3494 RepID=A0AA88ALX4_FICCA|nr:hypothetical protein TIFTF001_023528 [Ficus carica]
MKDSKSNRISWTENFYQKIEGIVPEVDDIMIQDTFKYVENHVNTVGGTFKKFCSDVVQDFFPLSVDPVKCEDEEVTPKGNVNNSVINIVQVSSDAEAKQSPVEIGAVEHADKRQDHKSIEHHNEDKLINAKSTDSHEDPDSIMAARKNNVLIKENCNLINDVDSIEGSADVPLEDTFKYVEDRVHAVGGAFRKFCSGVVQDFFPLSVDPENSEAGATTPEGDAAIGTSGSMAEDSLDAVVEQAPVATDAIDHSERQLGHVSNGHDENVDEFKNGMSMDSRDKSDSISAPRKINVLTNENSDLGNDVDVIKDSADEQLELNSHCVAESSEASSLDILADYAECEFSASSALSETAYSVVSDQDTVTVSGLVSSSSSILRVSAGTPGDSSNISPPEECSSDGCNQLLVSTPASTLSTEKGAIGKHLVSSWTYRSRYSSDISFPEECVSDSHKRLYSSTPALTMFTEDTAIGKQLVSSRSYSSLSLELNGGSSTVVADSGMETINLSDEAKLGDSCVFLDDSVLYDVSRRTRKLRSYKKKIQDIFASKKRLAKEYEQLAIWYGDTDLGLSQDGAPIGSQDLQTHHASDSEWELL